MTDLEKQILSAVQSSLTEGTKKALEGYSSPLHKLVEQVCEHRKGELFNLVDTAFLAAMKGEFRESLTEAIAHKMGRVLASKCEGELEKRVGELRQSPEFRARLTVAITDIVKDLSQPTK